MDGRRNTALLLSYLGTAYSGWQRQKNAMTVQQRLEEAIEKTCEARVSLSGCGRTDAGVHARVYVANAVLPTGIPTDRLPFALNARLPEDIVVSRALYVPDGFDSRFSCKSKAYTYHIDNQRVRDPFHTGRAYFYSRPLDIEAMRAGARHFVGEQDFAAVMSRGSPVKSTVREIYSCEIMGGAGRVAIRVSANGFLYNMVRAISGTLVYVGIGKLRPDEVRSALLSGDRERAGPTLPPDGLYLTDLHYGVEEIDAWTGSQE